MLPSLTSAAFITDEDTLIRGLLSVVVDWHMEMIRVGAFQSPQSVIRYPARVANNLC
jgi:hypothetical protein